MTLTKLVSISMSLVIIGSGASFALAGWEGVGIFLIPAIGVPAVQLPLFWLIGR